MAANFISNYFAGRQNADEEAMRGYKNQLGKIDVAQAQDFQNLAHNAAATPDQYARIGRSDVSNAIVNNQRQADEQKQAAAVRLVHAAQYASQVPQGQLKPFIERNFPELAQAAGSDWATATEDNVRSRLQGVAAKAGVDAGVGPAVEKFGKAENAVYKGKPSLVQIGDSGTVRPVADAAPYNKPEKPAAGNAYDPQSVENTAQMIANNQIPMISGFALKSPWGQEVISRVRELNPNYAGADYGSNAAGIKQFTSGKNGNTIRSLNVAVQHLDQLSQLSDALDSGNIPLFNRAAIAYKKATGQAAPANFDAAKKIVADEIVKAIVGSGGGVADREQAAASINSAQSPAQLKGVIETYQGLMTGQLNGLREQYKTSTGRDNFEDLLLPETKARLEVHGQGGQQSAAGGQRLTPEQAAKLPPGTQFIGMDGIPRVKH